MAGTLRRFSQNAEAFYLFVGKIFLTFASITITKASMLTRKNIHNFTFRLLCAIMLLMVQTDVLANDTSLFPSHTTEIAQPEAETETDDFCRKHTRDTFCPDTLSIPVSFLFAEFYTSDFKPKTAYGSVCTSVTKGRSIHRVCCVYLI